ncbi:hypothetical protein JL720_16688 [Aureococcus anophagefferens]|nr:hypothetical protein JL720_16688 [Aureococcus anophagefferens]
MQRHKLVRGGNKASSSRLPRRFVTCNHDQRKAALVDDVEAGGRGGGDATFGMTVITLMKICVGTGVLAVPHAFSGAGVVPGFGMLFALLCWNDWSANRLLACRDLLSDDERRRFEAPGGEVAAGRLALVAGPRVATSVEVCLCVLMFGVATAYFVALHDFLAATPLGPALRWRWRRHAAAACLALPLSLVDDIGALAYAGAAGLCAIFVSSRASSPTAWKNGRPWAGRRRTASRG